MEVYNNSFVDQDEFDFGNVFPYFKIPIERTRSKYEYLMDPLSEKIDCLPKYKQKKYRMFLINIIAHLSVLSRIIEKDIE